MAEESNEKKRSEEDFQSIDEDICSLASELISCVPDNCMTGSYVKTVSDPHMASPQCICAYCGRPMVSVDGIFRCSVSCSGSAQEMRLKKRAQSAQAEYVRCKESIVKACFSSAESLALSELLRECTDTRDRMNQIIAGIKERKIPSGGEAANKAKEEN